MVDVEWGKSAEGKPNQRSVSRVFQAAAGEITFKAHKPVRRSLPVVAAMETADDARCLLVEGLRPKPRTEAGTAKIETDTSGISKGRIYN